VHQPGPKPVLSVVTGGIAIVGCTWLFPASASASPQGHVALRTSVCGVGDDALWDSTRFCGSFAGDVLFGRGRNGDFGIGPFAEVSTAGFWDARYGGGLSVLAPVSADYPLVLSLGAFGHETEALSLGAQLFFGLRSYNFHGSYNLAAGLFAAAYRDVGESGATLVSVGVELDALLLAMPFLFAAGELR
jgi:hypothetical protein